MILNRTLPMVRRLHLKGGKDAKRPKKRRTMSQGGNAKKNECRALVPVGQETSPASVHGRAAAPFVVQLAANAKGYATYRAKRRADPAHGNNSYRAAASRSTVLPGGKLNYCA
jgi:hypothetical protein